MTTVRALQAPAATPPPADLLPTATTDPEHVRAVADEVVAGLGPQGGESLLAWLLERLIRLLDLPASGWDGGLWGTVAVLLATLVTATVVGLGLRWLARLRRDPARRAAAVDTARDARAWQADARAALASGRWRDAVRCLHRAVAAVLDEAGLVAQVPGRTAGELRAAVDASLPEAASAMHALTTLFERSWYGRWPVTGAQARSAEDLAGQVAAAARARAGTGPGAGRPVPAGALP